MNNTSRLVMLLMCGLTFSAVVAQTTSRDKRDREPEVTEKQLQQRAEKAELTLLTELNEVALEFEKQGNRESALEVLERIDKISPAATGIKERIATLREETLRDNGMKADIDTSRGWGTQPVAEVEAGKPFRIVAAGEYKLNFVTAISVTGLTSTDTTRDHIAEAPFGALIGVVLTDGKPGAPFAINAAAEITPKKSGFLFLRVNVPASAKCTGTIKVQLSGGVKTPTRR